MKRGSKLLLALTCVTVMLCSCITVGCFIPPHNAWTLSGPIPLNGMFPYAENDNFGNDYIAGYLENATGYEVKYHELSEDNAFNEVYNLLTNCEQYHFLKLTDSQFFNYIPGGTFLDLTPYLERTPSGRLLYELIDLTPGAWDSASYQDDNGYKHIYGVPNVEASMTLEYALVWNIDHLKNVGIDKVPETLTEVTEAFDKLNAEYGQVDGYTAFGIPSSAYCEVAQIMSAFEVPNRYFVDEDGNIQLYIYSGAIEAYAIYMSGLRRKGYIASDWSESSPEQTIENFADGLHSCVYLPYRSVVALINKTVDSGKLAEVAGIANDYGSVRGSLVDWTLRVRGDGSYGSIVQGKGRVYADEQVVSHYIVVPSYMANYADYVIDYLAKKMLAFDSYFGEEGVHWDKVSAPAGAPEYDPENPTAIYAYERHDENIFFVEPYEYSYHEYTPVYDEKNKNIINAAQGNEVIVMGGGYWVQLLDKYAADIEDCGAYTTGTVGVALRSLGRPFVDRGAWDKAVDADDTAINNPMSMAPPFEHWLYIVEQARMQTMRGIITAIGQDDEDKVARQLRLTRYGLKATMKKKYGIKYYYWSDDIVKEMTDWYKEVKLGTKA